MSCTLWTQLWNVLCDLCLMKKPTAKMSCTLWTHLWKCSLWPLPDEEAYSKDLERAGWSVLYEPTCEMFYVTTTWWRSRQQRCWAVRCVLYEPNCENVLCDPCLIKKQTAKMLSRMVCTLWTHLWNVLCDLCLMKKQTAKMLSRMACTLWTHLRNVLCDLCLMKKQSAKMLVEEDVLSFMNPPVKCSLWPLPNEEADSKDVEQDPKDTDSHHEHPLHHVREFL